MSVRLFAAVDLTDDARARVAEALGRLRADLRRADLDGAFKWVAVPNLHITLRFLGNVDEQAAARVIDVMHQPLDVGPASIVLDGLGTFPPKGRPRVLHCGCGDGADLLGALRSRVDARLRDICSWEEERRPFAPHLTLARGREGGGFDLPRFREILDHASWPAVSLPVEHVTLFSSRTLPAGPEYTARARAALRSV